MDSLSCYSGPLLPMIGVYKQTLVLVLNLNVSLLLVLAALLPLFSVCVGQVPCSTTQVDRNMGADGWTEVYSGTHWCRLTEETSSGQIRLKTSQQQDVTCVYALNEGARGDTARIFCGTNQFQVNPKTVTTVFGYAIYFCPGITPCLTGLYQPSIFHSPYFTLA